MNYKLPWTVTEISRQVHVITWNLKTTPFNCSALVMSDEHWDNQHCNLPFLKSHHEQALELHAPICKFGDTLCLMQGKWDKRADPEQLREEHRGKDYFNLIANTAIDFYKPYKQNIAVIGDGNHEVSILDHHNMDMVTRICQGLGVYHGGYWGYVLFRFKIASHTETIKLFYHHGYGGGGEVTRGFIDNNRTRGQYEADIYYSGHIHRRNQDENVMTRCNVSGIIEKKTSFFIRGSAYKDMSGSWSAMKGFASRPLGGWWIDFDVHRVNNSLAVIPRPRIAD